MADFTAEMEKRMRRVCGVEDDDTDVEYRLGATSGPEGCPTCDYGGGASAWVEINVWKKGKGVGYREFADLGELMRALDEINLD